MQKVGLICISPLPYLMWDDHTTLLSMISNYDLTEMCELLVSMSTALVLVTKSARVHQGRLGAAGFLPCRDSELIRRNETSYWSSN